MRYIREKGFISIPDNMQRMDEGVIGQILEREFGIAENNLSLRDLGTYELKGMRKGSGTLTLGHKKPVKGKTPNEIFEEFGYIRPSNRDPSIMKKKLFTTINGKKPNSLGLILHAKSQKEISMYHGNEFVCTWDLTEQIKKFDQIILVFADTRGKAGSRDEYFHFNSALRLSGLRDIAELIRSKAVVIDFCIDKPENNLGTPHDRGPHIRLYKSKLKTSYNDVEVIL